MACFRTILIRKRELKPCKDRVIVKTVKTLMWTDDLIGYLTFLLAFEMLREVDTLIHALFTARWWFHPALCMCVCERVIHWPRLLTERDRELCEGVWKLSLQFGDEHLISAWFSLAMPLSIPDICAKSAFYKAVKHVCGCVNERTLSTPSKMQVWWHAQEKKELCFAFSILYCSSCSLSY